MTYRGRFAPSPTGPLHMGSLACALSSYLDARAHEGLWLVRIEDIDPPRDVPGADRDILSTLQAFGLVSDEPIVYQSRRGGLYEQALAALKIARMVYGCACSRSEIARESARLSLAAGVYPGTCRCGTGGRPLRAWRFRTNTAPVSFTDRRCGPFSQNLESEVGDFVVRRADGLWAYQLAVVVDDAAQGVTDVVRGEDLLDNTPRQIALQRALRYPTPQYLHIPLICDAVGIKLSKQTKAARVPTDTPLETLESLWLAMGYTRVGARSLDSFLRTATEIWRSRCCP